ncbi:MAG TPA: flagellar hook-length control protein FliK, partial [Syntrophales bacterium]|nr:flagellar hook-length control protein FliK [Syntrophales bacterium]
MDSPGVQVQFDPVAPAETPKSRDVAPGRKRDDQSEGKEANAAAASLTASFAEILQSKKQDLKAGSEEHKKNDHSANGKKIGQKAPVDRESLTKGQAVAADKRAKSPVTGAQAQAVKESTAASAETAAKTLVKENKDSVQSAELPKKGTLSAAEEAQLKEMIQKNGVLSGRKDTTAQVKGVVDGEHLSRPEGVGAVKSMTAQEGEVLKNLSGGDETQTLQKPKTGKSGKAQQSFALRDNPDSEGKSSLSSPSADKAKQEFADLMENTQDRMASAGQSKKQAVQKDAGAESRGAIPARNDMAASVQDRFAGTISAVKPQAVMSQVLDGAVDVLRNGSGRVALTLQPPQLGKLDLDVAVKDNRVTMIMLADNQEVKQMLQSGMDDLRNALQDKGFQ